MTAAHRIAPDLTPDEAVAELFRRHGDDMFGLGLKMCGNRADAEDLVQETFLRAYRDWSKYRGDASPSTWLYTIAIRVCRRLQRRRSGEPVKMESLSRPMATRDETEDVTDHRATPLDATISNETRSTVQRALARLPLHYRLPLALKELTDFTVEEIARLLDLKPATVRSRVHRARLHLARELESGGDESSLDFTRICRDILETKQLSLDEGTRARLPSKDHCARCRSFMESLEISQRACREIAKTQVPDEVRRVLWREISSPD
jgi:RNA polymerase sigma-70 factor (ECF subfamily)